MAQIGTIKLQTQNNGTVSVPVFDTADAGSDVYDMVRVQTASGVGFVPFVSTGSAAYPYLRIQTQNQGVLAAHNEASLFSTTLVDGFEDNDMNEYTVDSNGGSQSTSTNRVWDGTYSFRFAQSGSTKVFSTPGDGLNYYPQVGDDVEWYVNHDYIETSETQVVVGSNGDPTNWTTGLGGSVNADSNNSSFTMDIYSREQGRNSVSIGNYLDEWLRGRMEWRNGVSTFYLYQTNGSTDRSQHTLIDSVSLDVSGNSLHNNRGFGFFANNFGSGGRRSLAYYDLIERID